MAISLRFHSSGAVPGDGRPIVMRGPNLTIGRGPENDVVLPDPDRQISKTHCVLENHNGNLVVVDLSTNGTFLNYGKVALGRTPTPLNDGDVLVMGPYELVVEVSSQSSEPLAPLVDDRASFGNAQRAPDPMQLLDDAGPGGDFLDSLLGGPTPKGPGQFRKEDDFSELLPPLGDEGPLLGPAPAQEMGPAMFDHGPSGSDAFRAPQASRSVIPDDWDDILSPAKPSAPAYTPPPVAPALPPQIPDDDIFGSDPVAAPASAPLAPSPVAETFDPFATDPNRKGRSADPVPPQMAAAPPVFAPVEPEAPPVAPAFAPAPAALPEFPTAVGGLDAARIFLAAVGAGEVNIPDADLPDAMGRMGRTLKSMITGLREILMTRASIKSEFRIEQTMINAGSNNPLKFSISPEQAIEAMVRPNVRGYLPAEEAAEKALEDIKAHEVAMVTGMEAALKGLLARLDPKALTEKIEAKGGGGGFLKNRKAQYWETYEAMYAEVSDQAENDFNELFAREFAKAYKDQLARLKAESQSKT
jgi:type VI secretion system protein